jgi:hypothetical protein
MRNSSHEMYTDGTYQANNPGLHREDSHWKAKQVASLLIKHKLHPSKILEVGTGAGTVLDQLSKIQPGIQQLSGFDISPFAITEASRIENKKLSFQVGELPADAHADLLLMMDVLEHVDDIYSFLRSLRDHADHFIFHIPLDLSCRTILKPHIMLQQRNDVGHIHYFSKEMVLWAIKDTGYEVLDWKYTKPVTDNQTSPTVFRRFKKTLRNLSFSVNKDLSAKLWGGYSMLLLLRKAPNNQ